MVYSILHISDLHRSPNDPIDNASLIASLDKDFINQKNENQKIGAIDAIIVSGDIVQGVVVGESDVEEKLEKQYLAASEFLNALVDRYLKGDKKRVVIVPGNHDVNWNISASSMKEVSDPPPNGHEDLRKYLTNPESNYRFSIEKRKLYQITDKELYDSRFEMYERFYYNFYNGLDMVYELQKERFWNLFELDNRNIVVAGFNSCYRNDCFRHVGAIPESAIANAHLKIKDSGKSYSLKIAVWHHNTSGPPEQSDYMDVKLVHQMINYGFRLGIHGHQHRTEVSPQTISVPSEATMVLVSAGSLCAGQRELPPGERRQYNIIEIDDDYQSAKVHIRQMLKGHVFGPRYFEEFGGKTYTDVKWTPETTPVGTTLDMKTKITNEKILTAEKMIKNGNEKNAIEVLSSIAELGHHGRKLLLEAFNKSDDWDGIVKIFCHPMSIDELISLVMAFCKLHRYQDAEYAVSTYGLRLEIDEAIKATILSEIQIKQDIHHDDK